MTDASRATRHKYPRVGQATYGGNLIDQSNECEAKITRTNNKQFTNTLEVKHSAICPSELPRAGPSEERARTANRPIEISLPHNRSSKSKHSLGGQRCKLDLTDRNFVARINKLHVLWRYHCPWVSGGTDERWQVTEWNANL
ncbi:hypothetical protein WA026_005595 [Henosepilachna vigintioctopunctata]|uniref:Uncharacterized protein n=1 Tax=Henosepilachna vigintioctopunctata TaxID=420089 RepID=A0AAW1TVI1_9CUCU